MKAADIFRLLPFWLCFRRLQPFVLVATLGQGPNAAMSRWGKVLQTWHNTTRMSEDIVSQELGAWTDNGGKDCDSFLPPNSAFFSIPF